MKKTLLIFALLLTSVAFAQAPAGTRPEGPFYQAPYCTGSASALTVSCTAGAIFVGGTRVAVTAGTVTSLTASKSSCAAPTFSSCDIVYADSAGALHFSAAYATAKGDGSNVILGYATTNTTNVLTFVRSWQSTVPADAVNAFAFAFNAAGTQQAAGHVVFGTCTLGTSCSVTLTGAAAFTSTSTYFCAANDRTTAAAVKIVNTSASQIDITGTSTDVIGYVCFGN